MKLSVDDVVVLHPLHIIFPPYVAIHPCLNNKLDFEASSKHKEKTLSILDVNDDIVEIFI
jgi:hypothetical protein